MEQRLQIALLCLLGVFCYRANGQLTQFPEYFKFGSASAAYQVEGAWDADGKGPNIWDDLCHQHPDYVNGRSNGNDASKSYELYKEDVRLLKEAGMQFYRFSISWARVMPKGDTATINEAGLKYYDNLIDELLANGIEPMITMYHWDLPSALQEWGGFTNPAIIDYFVDYADLLYSRYGDRVNKWLTFNEPSMVCDAGYGYGSFAPLIYSPGVGVYLCSHHLLIAHAKAYDLYQAKYKRPEGKVGIVINCGMSWPKDSNKPEDHVAAETALQFSCGLWGHPFFSEEGGYPQVMIDNVDRRSKNEGRAWSRLPVMDEETKRLLKGKSDFIGLNYYTSNYATPKTSPNPWVSFGDDQEIDTSIDYNWPVSRSSWLRSVPVGLRDLLVWFKNEYNNPEIIITENGWSDEEDLNDQGRIDYLHGHIQAVLDAINLGCNVTGHTTWSIIDNFEWRAGYSERFGMYNVNFNDPQRKRTAKNSVAYLRNIIETRKLPILNGK